MVRRRRLPVGLIVPALLVGLVALLGTLQYQWLGKVSEAEREQLRRSLQQRAEVFADDFDGEVTRLYAALRLSREAVDSGDWNEFSSAFDRWRTNARYPRLVRALYLVERAGQTLTLRRFDAGARRFGPPGAAWPPHLAPVRVRLAGGAAPSAPPGNGRPHIVTLAMAPVLADVPALVIPVAPPLLAPPPLPASAPISARFLLGVSGAQLVVDLDADYLRGTVLPGLVARHFPGGSAEGQHVAILSSKGSPIFVGSRESRPIDPAHADAVVPFFNVRLDILQALAREPEGSRHTFHVWGEASASPEKQRTMGGEASASPEKQRMVWGEASASPEKQRMVWGEASASPEKQRMALPGGTDAVMSEGDRIAVLIERRMESGRAAATSAQVRVQQAGWQLVVRHPAGSVDAAVLQARRRNLWLAFGILGVLAAGVVLVVVNARRSTQLGARQMDFVATVSHELRTPLAVIRSAAQNLSAGIVGDAEQARRYGQLIEDEGQRLTEMVEQILEYSRVNGDRPLRNPRPLDVGMLIAELATSFRDAAERAGVVMEVETPDPGLPPVVGDEAALRRALHNLVGNALKHASEGKWIGVSARVETVRGRREVQVTVGDRGPGIPPSELAHLFEPFYRGGLATERQVHGNGLGLTLVKRVAEVHGGTITAASMAGEGARFTLHLPAAGAAAAESVAKTESARAAGSEV